MTEGITIGRYLLHRQIARGGMATIHIARLMGDEGFSRIVAAKRLHPEFAEDADFVAMFLDEARIASKVHHRNVVPVLDVVTSGEEVVLVQEYVHGAPLHWLLRTAHEAKTHIPINVAVSIGCQVLAGLHAAHETSDEMGEPLNIVHRDVSPQNIMVSTDGTARLLDFGVAKASMTAHVTRDGTFKGKLAYSAPEHIKGAATRQSDVYSLAVVLWELIVGHRMHNTAQSEGALIHEVLSGSLPTITAQLAGEREWLGENRWRQIEVLEAIIKKGLAVDTSARWSNAAEMEAALASAVPPASTTGVAAWLKALGKDFLEGRDKALAAEEASWRSEIRPLSRRAATPVPGSVRTLRSETEISADRTAAGSVVSVIQSTVQPTVQSVVQPIVQPAPTKRRTVAVIAALGAAVVVLSLVMIFGGHGGRTAVAPSADVPVGRALAPSSAAPAMVAVPAPPVAAPPVAVPIPAPAAEPPPSLGEPRAPTASDRALDDLRPAKTVHATPSNSGGPGGMRKRIVAAPKASPTVPAAIPAAPAAVPAVAAPVPASDCNPPYYFSGSKKIFKPACL
jgi:serine/threonine protein kinase